jgi:hypothetical protein
MLFKGLGLRISVARVHGVRIVIGGESYTAPAPLVAALVAERRAHAEALVTERQALVDARADATRERNRAVQAEAAAVEAQERTATERMAHVERLRGLLDRIARGLASEGDDEEQLLARIEVACDAAMRDGELLRACSAWGRA